MVKSALRPVAYGVRPPVAHLDGHPITTRTDHMAETWLSYAELAERLGISPEAARAKARRHRWRRQLDNGGLARVFVNLDDIPTRTHPDGHQVADRPDTRPDVRPADSSVQMAVAALEAHVNTLKDQLAKAEALATDRSREVALERERVADLTSQILRLTMEMLEVRKAETKPRSWWQRWMG